MEELSDKILVEEVSTKEARSETYIPTVEEARKLYGNINKPYVEEIFASAKCCGCRTC